MYCYIIILTSTSNSKIYKMLHSRNILIIKFLFLYIFIYESFYWREAVAWTYQQLMYLHLAWRSCPWMWVPASASDVPVPKCEFLHLNVSSCICVRRSCICMWVPASACELLDLHVSSCICKWVPRLASDIPASGASLCICKWVFNLQVTFLHLGWVRASGVSSCICKWVRKSSCGDPASGASSCNCKWVPRSAFDVPESGGS